MRDIGPEYERNFRGMTTEPVELDALLAARERMGCHQVNEPSAL